MVKFNIRIKRYIYYLFNQFGYKIANNKKTVKNNNFDAIINFLLSDDKKFLFFDVGANLGQSIRRFKKIKSNTMIHSFEPTPDLSEKIKREFYNDKNVKINNCGVAEKKGFLNFYSYKYHKINSLVKIDEDTKFYKSRLFTSENKKNDFLEIIKIKVTDIDSYCDENNINEIDFIKIDTQGSEDLILLGMDEMLTNNKISIIELELILGFGYEENKSFYDYEKILKPKNYRLIAISNSGNIIGNSNYQTNLLYVKKDLYEKIENLHKINEKIPGVMEQTNKSYPFSY